MPMHTDLIWIVFSRLAVVEFFNFFLKAMVSFSMGGCAIVSSTNLRRMAVLDQNLEWVRRFPW